MWFLDVHQVSQLSQIDASLGFSLGRDNSERINV